ncbi:MAG: hypothetical protein ACKPKO_41815, partial [Candidatus Fonsibacter sp.]
DSTLTTHPSSSEKKSSHPKKVTSLSGKHTVDSTVGDVDIMWHHVKQVQALDCWYIHYDIQRVHWLGNLTVMLHGLDGCKCYGF